MALAPIRFWRDVRLGPDASLGQWTSVSEDPWRDREWLRSGWGSAVLLAWKMVTLDSRLSCAVHNAEAAAKKLWHTHYLEAYFERDAKRRRLGIPAPAPYRMPATSSSASFRPPRPDPIDIGTESEHEALGTP